MGGEIKSILNMLAVLFWLFQSSMAIADLKAVGSEAKNLAGGVQAETVDSSQAGPVGFDFATSDGGHTYVTDLPEDSQASALKADLETLPTGTTLVVGPRDLDTQSVQVLESAQRSGKFSVNIIAKMKGFSRSITTGELAKFYSTSPGAKRLFMSLVYGASGPVALFFYYGHWGAAESITLSALWAVANFYFNNGQMRFAQSIDRGLDYLRSKARHFLGNIPITEPQDLAPVKLASDSNVKPVIKTDSAQYQAALFGVGVLFAEAFGIIAKGSIYGLADRPFQLATLAMVGISFFSGRDWGHVEILAGDQNKSYLTGIEWLNFLRRNYLNAVGMAALAGIESAGNWISGRPWHFDAFQIIAFSSYILSWQVGKKIYQDHGEKWGTFIANTPLVKWLDRVLPASLDMINSNLREIFNFKPKLEPLTIYVDRRESMSGGWHQPSCRESFTAKPDSLY